MCSNFGCQEEDDDLEVFLSDKPQKVKITTQIVRLGR